MQAETLILVGAAAVAVIAAVAVALYAVRRLRRERAELRGVAFEKREIATIEEEVRVTPFGLLCGALCVAGIGLLAFGGLSTDARQVVLVGAGLCGLGAALGRRKILVVYRSEPPEP